MERIREQLQGTPQSARVRRMKRAVLALLTVLVVLLSMSVLSSEGAGLTPFYFPVDAVLPLLLILLLVVSFTNFAFRGLEMRHAKREGLRFVIARRSIQRALVVIVVCAMLGAILILLFAQAEWETVRSGSVPPSGVVALNFTSQDALAVSQVVFAEVTVRQPQRSLDVWVTWTGESHLGGLRQDASRNVPLSFAVNGANRVDYLVQMRNNNPMPVEYILTLRGRMASELVTFVPALLFALAATNAVWVAYLRPIRSRSHAAAASPARYAAEASPSGQTYAESNRPAAMLATPTRQVARKAAPTIERTAGPPTPLPRPEARPKSEPVGVPPSDLGRLLAEGRQSFEAGELDSALSRFDAALELEPENVTALLAAAAILLRLQRRDEASGTLKRVLDIDPKNPNALSSLAEVLEADGRWGEAAATWSQYAALAPKDSNARLRHAEALIKAKDRDGAMRVLEEARRSFPDDGRIRVHLEETHVDVPSLLSKALAASAAGRLEQAISLLDRVLVQEPDNVNALVNRGVALGRANRKYEALTSLDAALQRQPTNTAALRAKAQILEEGGALEDAVAVYESLHEASPHDPAVFALQAAAYEKLDKNEQALAGYQQAMALDPHNATYRAKVEALMKSRGSQERFMEELFTIKGMGPARVRALLDAGYRTPDSIRGATEEELAKVSGLTRTVARDVRRHFRGEPTT